MASELRRTLYMTSVRFPLLELVMSEPERNLEADPKSAGDRRTDNCGFRCVCFLKEPCGEVAGLLLNFTASSPLSSDPSVFLFFEIDLFNAFFELDMSQHNEAL